MPLPPEGASGPSETLVVLATGNPHKVVEISQILAGRVDLPRVRLVAAGVFTGIEEPEETGATFEENALLKARYWAEATGHLALADDSGLVVDALGGRPGVRSARYESTSERRNRRVLDELKDVPADERAARFVCVAAMADPEGNAVSEEGRIEGWITTAPKGEGGFGYDPIFEPRTNGERGGRTLAEYSAEEKNGISHRGRAFTALAPRVEAAVRAGRVVTDRAS